MLSEIENDWSGLQNFVYHCCSFSYYDHKYVVTLWFRLKLKPLCSVLAISWFLFSSGWSVLLSRKALKRASKDLREMCCWHSDVPSILSACLVSMEPDSNLRLMTDQYTPDERFGQNASNCQLSTPRDASCTHILVFPTSAKAQVTLTKN